MQVHGVNIIRAYELSWLNSNGKPQLAVLEITQACSEASIDTWQLKNFLESINNKIYNNTEDLKQQIIANIDAPNSAAKLILQPDFADLEFFEMLHTTNILNNGLRFICSETGQPYIGTVNVCCDSMPNIHNKLMANLLMDLRNKKFIPQEFVNEVFFSLQQLIKQDFVLSVHLNRRGGISYQFLRSAVATDFLRYKQRAILE